MKVDDTSTQNSSTSGEQSPNAATSQSAMLDEQAFIKRQIERALPLPEERAAALSLFAHVIETCHDERPAGWYAHAKSGGLWVSAGRLTACHITRGVVELSVVGPLDTGVLAELGANEGEAGAWKAIPGALYLQFSAAKAGAAQKQLAEPLRRFISDAMARMRTSLDSDKHSAAVVTYVAEQLALPLPQPDLVSDDPEIPAFDEEDSEAAPNREPVERGRSPIFEKSQRTVVSLLADIKQGRIALPDLQRPFVWEDAKVRDLLDSLFVGYPTGTVVLWQTDEPRDARVLGGQAKTTTASSLVIDGQQRLTSLYAVLHGIELQDRDGDRRRIKIAFRPRDGRFEVADAATTQDPEYLSDISVLWDGKQSNMQLRRELLARLRERDHVVSQTYEDAVEHNLERLKAIESFEFPVIELRKNEATDEQVADIFVRINNQGTRLGQADFVLTLLSVYHGSLREKIERRASEMTTDSNSHVVDTQQLLRAACAVAFERARMSAIYKFLRGLDPSSGDISEPARESRLKKLDQAAEACIATTTWRDYLLRVSHAGFVSPKLVTSPGAVMNAFAFYVKGQQAGLEKHRKDSLISRWLFATLLTARYSSSAETMFEADLARVRGLGAADGDKFERALDEILKELFTDDYWRQTLVRSLATQRSHAPSAMAFRAAQIVLGARALFTDSSMQTMLTPGPNADRAATERHHLFPKAWLGKLGVSRALVNQVANLADVGWNINAEIGAGAPAVYVPRLREKLKLDDERWGRMCAEHALPVGWETLSYSSFLEERRHRMAEVIRAAFRKLGGEEDAAPVPPPWFLPGADLVWKQISATEQALRVMVREIYSARFGARAAERIEAAFADKERDSLARALRARPAEADPMTVIDYLYLAQLPPLLFANDVWADAKARMGNRGDAKQRLSTAIGDIVPVRNEIAHVREVAPARLQKASVACNDVLALIGAKGQL